MSFWCTTNMKSRNEAINKVENIKLIINFGVETKNTNARLR